MSRVLVVDDEPMIVELFSMMLEVGGHEVVATARNGQEAVEAFAAPEPLPEVVLMDYRMPGKDGIEATKEILESHPFAKVVIVSADMTVGPDCAPAGAAGYLEKPVAMVVLLETVNRVAKSEPGAAPD